MERRLTAGAPKREDTTTERLMREFEAPFRKSFGGGGGGGGALFF